MLKLLTSFYKKIKNFGTSALLVTALLIISNNAYADKITGVDYFKMPSSYHFNYALSDNSAIYTNDRQNTTISINALSPLNPITNDEFAQLKKLTNKPQSTIDFLQQAFLPSSFIGIISSSTHINRIVSSKTNDKFIEIVYQGVAKLKDYGTLFNFYGATQIYRDRIVNVDIYGLYSSEDTVKEIVSSIKLN